MHTLPLDQRCSIIADELTLRYGRHDFALFYGSMAAPDRPLTPRSDIDLIVVYEHDIEPYREIFTAHGIKFDVFVYDAGSLHFQIRHARRNVLLDMVADAIVLPRPHPTATYLKALAIQMAAMPMAPFNSAPTRLLIGNTVDDLEFSTDPVERNCMVVELYKLLFDLQLTGLGKQGWNKRHAIAELRQRAPHFIASLDQALTASQTDGDVRPMLALANEIVCAFGGQVGDGYQAPLGDGRRLPLPGRTSGASMDA